jgi:curved DNA-binding protein CbpA
MALETNNGAPRTRIHPEIDYYAILQVHPLAHAEVIKRAYHAILGVLGAHPDHGGSHEYAVLVNEAYAVLSNPELRHVYDVARRRLTVQSTPVHRAHGETRTVTCRWCGTRNRFPRETDLRYALCCRCHGFLSSGW